MNVLIGLIICVACMLGGYVLSHGVLRALWQPYELMIIGGTAFGTMVMANKTSTIISIFKTFPILLKGTKYKKPQYLDLLSLMYDVFNKMRKDGMLAMENDIEDPDNSTLFARYPEIHANKSVIEFITDYLRLIISGNMNSFELDALIDSEICAHHDNAHAPASAMLKTADALPGFGIVAAVLGVVITMGALDGPMEEIGAHIAAALTGTFMGIFLAYGVVGPIASAMENLVDEETKFLECIKSCIIANLNGSPPQVAVEFGRKVIFHEYRPSFYDLENHIKNG